VNDSGRTRLKPRTQPKPIRQLQLVVVEGPGKGTVHEPFAEGPISVGSSPDNDIVLADATVSRYHLELKQQPDGIRVTDLGSRNGTTTAGVRLVQVIVQPGTRLTLGSSVVELAEGAALDPTDPEAGAPVPGLIGHSAAMTDVARQVRRLAATDASVLIEGETGVGKEVVARAIHQLSPRRDDPLVVVDCGSLPATLIASELFGHERGAFTGADQRRIGAFESANGGTIFLDEIGELPLQLQPALLGALERRRFRRLGATKEIEVDVRLLSATNRDLRAEANEGSFRADLYFRLAVARVRIPPLRERPEDIEPLVQHFVQEQHGTLRNRPSVSARSTRYAGSAGVVTCASCATWSRPLWPWGEFSST
jgi:transcriptional regulator of acetoin/glycerol metabolism